MVPGSTLMYGSSLHMVTARPRALRRRPRDDAVSPLPRELETPPVTKTNLLTGYHLGGPRRAARTAGLAGALPKVSRPLRPPGGTARPEGVSRAGPARPRAPA